MVDKKRFSPLWFVVWVMAIFMIIGTNINIIRDSVLFPLTFIAGFMVGYFGYQMKWRGE